MKRSTPSKTDVILEPPLRSKKKKTVNTMGDVQENVDAPKEEIPAEADQVGNGLADGGAVGGALMEDYDKRVRPLIDLVDRLRHIGLDKDVKLPSIVVVGDQSTGKSSVLEAISAVQLPRGTGIVTRCPLELRMKKSATEGWKGRIALDDSKKVEEWGNSNQLDIQEPGQIDQVVRQAQDALAGEGKGISDQLISLEIESPTLPDLTLIDLPGIVRVSMAGQPADTPEKIRNLITKYIRNEKTIILAVVPATADIETSDALNMAKIEDPEHRRTLGVITKTDLVDRGAEHELLAVLCNERYKLEKGYIAVKCRGQQAIQNKLSLEAALDEEDTFFEKEVFQKLPKHMYGIRSLSKKLSEELVAQVEHVLPGMKTEIYEKLDKTRRNLEKLGIGIPVDPREKTRFFMQFVTAYCDILKQLADGHEQGIDVKHRLFNVNRRYFFEFATEVNNRWKAKLGRGTDFRWRVERAMEEDRGHELPRFIKYDTFKLLVTEILMEFLEPADICLRCVTQGVKERLTELAVLEFKRFPRLVDRAKQVITDVIENNQAKAEVALEDLVEMEKLVFCQDSKYNNTLDEILAQMMKQQGSEGKPSKLIDGVGYLDLKHDKKKDVDTMFNLIKAYMDISVARLADTVPMVILQNMLVRVIQDLRIRINEFLLPESGALDTLTEKRDVVLTRVELRARLERLRNATVELQNFSVT